jgi:hypothetical protein
MTFRRTLLGGLAALGLGTGSALAQAPGLPAMLPPIATVSSAAPPAPLRATLIPDATVSSVAAPTPAVTLPPIATSSSTAAPTPPPATLPPVATVTNVAACPAATPAVISDPANPEGDGGLVGGGGFYLLRPFFRNNVAFQVVQNGIPPVGPTVLAQTSTTNFDWNMQPAGAFWVGWTADCGLGVRGRYFFFDENSSPLGVFNTPTSALNPVPPGGFRYFINPSPLLQATPAPAGTVLTGVPPQQLFSSPSTSLTNLGAMGGTTTTTGDLLTFTSKLQINAVDAEATFTYHSGGIWLIGSAGGRYLQLAQLYRGTLINHSTLADGSASVETETLEYSQDFHGGGLTAAGQFGWQIGQTNLAIVASARGSVVVGANSQVTHFTHIIANNGSAVLVSPLNLDSQLSSSTDMVLPVLELELGLEYGIRLGGKRVFVRAAAVDQTYFGTGNASGGDSNLSLFGVQFSAGLNF